MKTLASAVVLYSWALGMGTGQFFPLTAPGSNVTGNSPSEIGLESVNL